MDTFTLTCPTCGAKLKITNDIDRFVCLYCGNEHIVKRDGGIVTLKPVIDGLQKIGTSVDKTASELAIKRLKEEIMELKDQYALAFESQKQSTHSLLISIVAILMGVYFLLNHRHPLVLAISIVLITGGIAFSLYYYRSKSTRKKMCNDILSEAKEKETLLEKHRKIVGG